MSLEEIRWNPWLDDMARIVESMTEAIDLLMDDNNDQNGIEKIKIELHSIKGLYDSVGLKTSTQTIFELEESVHASDDGLDESLIERLSKALVKIKELVNVVRRDKPKPNEIDSVDKAIGFEAILVKFGSEYIVEIEIAGERSLRSARGLGVFNSIKRFATIKSSTPPEEDLYLDAKFDNLIMTIFTREDMESFHRTISSLPNVSNVTIEKVAKEEEREEISEEDLAQNLTIRVPLSNIRAIESGLATLSIHVEALKSEVVTSRGVEELSGIDRAFERIQSDIKKMRKVPLDSITTTFPSMVKRLAKQEGKDIDLLIQGRFITLDRSLANHLIDPITQIIRNAISHGIEGPAERRELKKDQTGRIVINASSDRDKIRIRIMDDGYGIDENKIIQKANKMNIPVSSGMDQDDIFNLIFHKGFSLSEGGQISGRGIGLYSAKERISQIGGNLTVTSDFGKGTTFTVEFSDPDALSRNLIFTINEDTYAIPSSEVEQVLIVDFASLKMDTDVKATMPYEGKTLPVTIMRHLITANGSSDSTQKTNGKNEILLVCRGRKTLIGLLIDNLLDERLVNIRPLNPLLQKYELFNGTLAGRDREVILVVNPASIM